MTVETATNISQLNASYPAASDPKSEGDDHIRLVKSTLLATFPGVTGIETTSAGSNSSALVATTSQVAAAILASSGVSASLPGQSGSAGKVLGTNGSTASWVSVPLATGVNAAEVVTISATAASGSINFNIADQSVLYYTINATGNWTLNLRASASASLDSAMSTGSSLTVAFLVTQGATPYYNNAVQVDGVAVTPKYQGGSAWAAGNASSVDAYVYTIIKTGSATFTVLASQTRFA